MIQYFFFQIHKIDQFQSIDMGNCIRTDNKFEEITEENHKFPPDLPHRVGANVTTLEEKNQQLIRSLDQTHLELKIEMEEKLQYKFMLVKSDDLIEQWVMAYSSLKRQKNKVVRENQVLKYQMRDDLDLYNEKYK